LEYVKKYAKTNKENTKMIILRQKEYARRDYAGLTDSEKEILRKKRAALAKEEFGKYRKAVNSVEKHANCEIGLLNLNADGLGKDYAKKKISNIKKNAAYIKMDAADKALQAIDSKKKNLRREAVKDHKFNNMIEGYIGNMKGRGRQRLKEVNYYKPLEKKRRMDFLKRVEEYKAAKAAKAKARALVPINNQAEQAAEKGFKLGKKGKIGLAAVGTSLAAGGAYAGYKYYKNKNKKD
jgi:hypothetical protein